MFKRDYIPAWQPSEDEIGAYTRIAQEIQIRIEELTLPCAVSDCLASGERHLISAERLKAALDIFDEVRGRSFDYIPGLISKDGQYGFSAGGFYFTGIIDCMAAADAHEYDTNIKLGNFFPVLMDDTEHEEEG